MRRYDQGGAEHDKRRVGKASLSETSHKDDHDARSKQRETRFFPMHVAICGKQTGATDNQAGRQERPFEALLE